MTVVQWFLLAAAISILVGATCGLFSFYLTCREAAELAEEEEHQRRLARLVKRSLDADGLDWDALARIDSDGWGHGEELGREAADQIGVGAHPRCDLGESGDHAADADTSVPYNWADDAA